MKDPFKELERRMEKLKIIKISPEDIEKMNDEEKAVTYHIGMAGLLGEVIGKKLDVDIENHKEELLMAGAYACDKLWGIRMRKDDPLYHKFEEDELREIVFLTGAKYLLEKDVLPEDKKDLVLGGIEKYREAFSE